MPTFLCLNRPAPPARGFAPCLWGATVPSAAVWRIQEVSMSLRRVDLAQVRAASDGPEGQAFRAGWLKDRRRIMVNEILGRSDAIEIVAEITKKLAKRNQAAEQA